MVWVRWLCSKTMPNPSEHASSLVHVCRFGLKIFRHGVVVSSNFSFPIAFFWGFTSLNLTSFFSRLRLGERTYPGFGNFPKYVIIPKTRWSLFTEFGDGIFVIASIFTGSTFTTSGDIILSSNTMDFIPI